MVPYFWELPMTILDQNGTILLGTTHDYSRVGAVSKV